MKATIEYELPDEIDDLKQALRANEVLAAVHDFSQYLRSQEKYLEPEERDNILQIRERWFNTLGEFLEY